MADIDALQLWADDGDGLFAPATDLALSDLAGVGAHLGRAGPGPRDPAGRPPPVREPDRQRRALRFGDGPAPAAGRRRHRGLGQRRSPGRRRREPDLAAHLHGAAALEPADRAGPQHRRADGDGDHGRDQRQRRDGHRASRRTTSPSTATARSRCSDGSDAGQPRARQRRRRHVRLDLPRRRDRRRPRARPLLRHRRRGRPAPALAGHRLGRAPHPRTRRCRWSIYPVANLPFSINRGQAGVVPLTLTLVNGGDDTTADIRLTRLVMTLDDGEGHPVVPADLLSRVLVNEGVNVYCNEQDLRDLGPDRDPRPRARRRRHQPRAGDPEPAAGHPARHRGPAVPGAPDDRPATSRRCDHVSQVPVAPVLLDGHAIPVSSGTGAPRGAGHGPDRRARRRPRRSPPARARTRSSCCASTCAAPAIRPSRPTCRSAPSPCRWSTPCGRRLPDAADRVQRLRVLGSLAVHAEALLTTPPTPWSPSSSCRP